MKISQIEKELAKIYSERGKWDGGKGPFTELEVKYRELILVKQRILQQLEEALLHNDKGEQKFNLILLDLVNDRLKILESKRKNQVRRKIKMEIA